MEIHGIIESYRRGPRTQKNNQMIIYLPSLNSNDIPKLVGASVLYRDKYGNAYEGIVKKRHGNGNKVLAEFKRALPGTSLGDIVKIVKRD